VSGHACKDTNLMSANTGISHSQMLDSLELRRRVKQDVVDAGDRRNGMELSSVSRWRSETGRWQPQRNNGFLSFSIRRVLKCTARRFALPPTLRHHF
jgi:hypothetical protein